MSGSSNNNDLSVYEELENTLWAHLQSLGEFDKEAVEYREQATRRETGDLSADQKSLVEKMDSDIGFETKQCYRNTQLAISFYGGQTTHDIQYVEGYVISNDVPIPVQHAWIELDGTVAEITLPKARIQSERWVYVGMPFENSVVREAINNRGAASPLAGEKEW